MENTVDLKSRIDLAFKKMSKGQKRIADYILTNYDKAAFMTASKLGDKVGISESTVVRFAIALGYDGYPRLQKALQEMIRNKLTTVQRIEMTSDMQPTQILHSVLKSDVNNIRMTINDIDSIAFENVVDKAFEAKRIFILGLRSSAPLAEFLGYYLGFILPNVVTVTSGVRDVFEQLMGVREGDMVIGISFPRYATRTIEALQYAKNKGALIVSVTDSTLSPLAENSDYCLIAHSDMASFVDSLVAPLSVINALIVAISLRKKEQVSNYFNELESIWEKYNVYKIKEDK